MWCSILLLRVPNAYFRISGPEFSVHVICLTRTACHSHPSSLSDNSQHLVKSANMVSTMTSHPLHCCASDRSKTGFVGSNLTRSNYFFPMSKVIYRILCSLLLLHFLSIQILSATLSQTPSTYVFPPRLETKFHTIQKPVQVFIMEKYSWKSQTQFHTQQIN